MNHEESTVVIKVKRIEMKGIHSVEDLSYNEIMFQKIILLLITFLLVVK